MVEERCGPSKLPLAWFTFWLAIAVRTSSRDRPSEATARGLTCTRTAGFWPPLTVTSPTPLNSDSFGARRVSARSSICVVGSVCEVSANVSTAASAGLTLL